MDKRHSDIHNSDTGFSNASGRKGDALSEAVKFTGQGNGAAAFTIRRTEKSDHAPVYELIRTAFETAAVSDGSEQNFAVQLRESPGYIPELDLVAEFPDGRAGNGRPAGHIMLTRTYISGADGKRTEALLAAPLSVLLEYRGTGIGSALMREGLRRARGMGFRAAFLCGDPGYYGRFGFLEMGRFGIRSGTGVPERYSLALEFLPGALNGTNGELEGF